MAKFIVAGVELVEERVSEIDRIGIRRIVEAGAKAAADRMRENTMLRRHVRTGDMLKSVAGGEYREFYGGGQMEVYPQGTDRKGERNATKAYVINYGRGRRKRNGRMGDKFITGDEKQAEEIIREAMQKESDRVIAESEK